MINYEDFKKVEIKIGEIQEAHRIDRSDKLLLLKVDFGEENIRTVVSGIAQYFNPDELAGVQCSFVTNLEPRPLMGHESEAMILGAYTDDGFALIKPSLRTIPGTILG